MAPNHQNAEGKEIRFVVGILAGFRPETYVETRNIRRQAGQDATA